MNRDRALGLGAITVTSVLWGTTGTAATFAPSAGPLAIGAVALGVGGLLQAVVAINPLRRARATLRAHRALVLLGASAVAIYPLAFYSSMHTAGVAVGSVVSLASAPLVSGVLDLATDRRPLSRWWVFSVGLGIVGSLLLCLSKIQGSAGSAGSSLVGIGLGLVAGTAYATYSWTVSQLMTRKITRSASMGAVFGAGGLFLMPVLIMTGAPLLASPADLSVSIYMAVIPMFFGYWLFGFGLARVAASTATTATLTEPAVATLLAIIVVGEELGPLGWIGLGAIGTVLLLLALAPTNTTRQDKPKAKDATVGPSRRLAAEQSGVTTTCVAERDEVVITTMCNGPLGRPDPNRTS